PHPVVERRRQARVVQRPDVPDDEPAGPVHGQVYRVHGETLGVDDRVNHVQPEGQGERTQAGGQQPAARRVVFPRGRARTGEDRSHLANPSGSGRAFWPLRDVVAGVDRPGRAWHSESGSAFPNPGGAMSGVGQLVTSGPLILALPVAAAAGAVTFLSPCCLPLVPGYLSFVTGMAGAGGSPAPAAPVSEAVPA